jgi:hypothetical protein
MYNVLGKSESKDYCGHSSVREKVMYGIEDMVVASASLAKLTVTVASGAIDVVVWASATRPNAASPRRRMHALEENMFCKSC